MKKKLLLGLSSLFLTITYDYAQVDETEYSLQHKGTYTNHGFGQTTDSDNNLITYTEGQNEEDVQINGNSTPTLPGNTPIITKFNDEGTTLWTASMNAGEIISDAVYLFDITTDTDKNIYVSGSISNTSLLIYEEDTISTNINGFGTSNFILKLNENGTLLWDQVWKQNGITVISMITDENNNLFFGGRYDNDFIFNNITYTPQNSGSAFVAKYDENGNEIAFTDFSYSRNVKQLKVDSDGNIIVSQDIMLGYQLPNGNTASEHGYAVARIDNSTLNTIDLFLTDKTPQYLNPKIELTSNNDVYLTQTISDTLTINGQEYGSFPAGTSPFINNNPNAVGSIIKLNGNDLSLNAVKLFDSGIKTYTIGIDTNDKIYLGSIIELDTVNIDANEIVVSDTANPNLILLQIDNDLSYLWSKDVADAEAVISRALSVNNTDEIYLSAALSTFNDSLVTIDGVNNTIGYGGLDNFAIKLTSNNAVSLIDNTHAKLSIYPNPAIDILSISSQHVLSTISIVDLTGKVIEYLEVNTNIAKVNISDLENGTYLVRIVDAHGNLTQNKIQVVH